MDPTTPLLDVDPREVKLPTWARYHLAALRRELSMAVSRVTVAETTAEQARLATNPDTARIKFTGEDGDEIGLPDGAVVTMGSFQLELASWGDGLLVDGSEPVAVDPIASNVIRVRLRKPKEKP
jgi:hypothetical protein